MEKLDALASLVRLSDRIVRILGQNPGKFTLQGTNTYLIGEHAPYTLIDTGEGRPGYIPLLESALEHGIGQPSETAPRQHISDIIISHWHPDHVGGLFSVLGLLRSLWDAFNAPLPFQPPRIHKFPHTSLPDDRFQRAIESIEPGMYTPSPSGSLFHDLHDGQSFPISDAASHPNARFQVIHCPGHTEDSIALLFPSEQVLYTADTVLGQGTAVFEDLGSYISTLRSLLSYIDKDIVLYPAHGPVVHNGEQVIKSYIDHRMERETQIVRVLQRAPEDIGGTWSTWEIVSKIYAAYPTDLWEPAARSVDQHLRKLVAEGKVQRLGGKGKDTKWKLQTNL
ncbi:beta-lactamase-like protein [Boletus edulis BED1]|uniref:Beta-lactamase-like protein n=1 Tax=Boletus edulis BED1 TaxID=1328754 RepID=A0AAD4BJ54_BOLED|nr:beta-lactamase-like protein [Boletus edulis BED1]